MCTAIIHPLYLRDDLPQTIITAYTYHFDADNNVDPLATVENGVFAEYDRRCPSICC